LREQGGATIAVAEAGRAAPDPRILLAWMVKMATVDGKVDPTERDQLAQFAARWRIPPEQVAAMTAAGLAGNLSVSDPHDSAEARSWLNAMATAAWADGKVTREEMELLRSVGASAGLSGYDINQLVRNARSQVLTDAKAALREKRGG